MDDMDIFCKDFEFRDHVSTVISKQYDNKIMERNNLRNLLLDTYIIVNLTTHEDRSKYMESNDAASMLTFLYLDPLYKIKKIGVAKFYGDELDTDIDKMFKQYHGNM